jgi:hypothetical protein
VEAEAVEVAVAAEVAAAEGNRPGTTHPLAFAMMPRVVARGGSAFAKASAR